MISMEIALIIVYACITIFSFGLCIVSFLSFYKFKNLKLIFVCLAFLVFFIKGILQSLGLFVEEFAIIPASFYLGLLDLIILILLFLATLKR